MFAVIKSGGKQYKVSKNSVVKLEKLAGALGSTIVFDQVMLISTNDRPLIVGSPYIAGAQVQAEIIEQSRDAKIIVFKKQRRQHYRRKNGHRQSVTHVLIKSIMNGELEV